MDHSSTIDSILWPSNLPQSKTRRAIRKLFEPHRASNGGPWPPPLAVAARNTIDRVNPLLPSKIIKVALVYIYVYKAPPSVECR